MGKSVPDQIKDHTYAYSAEIAAAARIIGESILEETSFEDALVNGAKAFLEKFQSEGKFSILKGKGDFRNFAKPFIEDLCGKVPQGIADALRSVSGGLQSSAFVNQVVDAQYEQGINKAYVDEGFLARAIAGALVATAQQSMDGQIRVAAEKAQIG
jgi:hypothetical protein